MSPDTLHSLASVASNTPYRRWNSDFAGVLLQLAIRIELKTFSLRIFSRRAGCGIIFQQRLQLGGLEETHDGVRRGWVIRC